MFQSRQFFAAAVCFSVVDASHLTLFSLLKVLLLPRNIALKDDLKTKTP